jgi:elongation factor Ts
MQIAALDPKYVRREDVTPEVLQQERDIQRARAIAEGKPPQVADKIVDGRMAKFFEEFCLYEQPFIKDGALTIGQLVATKITKTGENITVSRFTRFKVGDTPGE